MACGSGVRQRFGLRAARGQAVKCQRTVPVTQTVIEGLRLAAIRPPLECDRRVQEVSATSQGRSPWA